MRGFRDLRPFSYAIGIASVAAAVCLLAHLLLPTRTAWPLICGAIIWPALKVSGWLAALIQDRRKSF